MKRYYKNNMKRHTKNHGATHANEVEVLLYIKNSPVTASVGLSIPKVY